MSPAPISLPRILKLQGAGGWVPGLSRPGHFRAQTTSDVSTGAWLSGISMHGKGPRSCRFTPTRPPSPRSPWALNRGASSPAPLSVLALEPWRLLPWWKWSDPLHRALPSPPPAPHPWGLLPEEQPPPRFRYLHRLFPGDKGPGSGAGSFVARLSAGFPWPVAPAVCSPVISAWWRGWHERGSGRVWQERSLFGRLLAINLPGRLSLEAPGSHAAGPQLMCNQWAPLGQPRKVVSPPTPTPFSPLLQASRLILSSLGPKPLKTEGQRCIPALSLPQRPSSSSSGQEGRPHGVQSNHDLWPWGRTGHGGQGCWPHTADGPARTAPSAWRSDVCCLFPAPRLPAKKISAFLVNHTNEGCTVLWGRADVKKYQNTMQARTSGPEHTTEWSLVRAEEMGYGDYSNWLKWQIPKKHQIQSEFDVRGGRVFPEALFLKYINNRKAHKSQE